MPKFPIGPIVSQMEMLLQLSQALRLPLLACVVAMLAIRSVQAAPPPEFTARAAAVLEMSGVPGLAIAIVENEQVVLSAGFGIRKLGALDRVTPDTIFPIASCGKAITAAGLATLVDAGKIGWDDKVIDHLRWFQMYDPYVTREMTIRDLLVHRSGLGEGAGDLLFVPRGSLSRAESVRRLRYIKPATSFRSAYAYDNLLYMVAGQMIEEIAGDTWEVFMRERVLKPAGMSRSTSDDADPFRTSDRAHPHARLNGPFQGLGDMELLNEREGLGENASPAGGISTSANDIARWLQIQLRRGEFPGGTGRLFSESASEQMWTPQTLMPIEHRTGALAAAVPQFQSYALGWEVRDWRGHKIVWHDGADIGFGAVVVLLPEKNVAFALMANAVDGVLLAGLMYELLDHYLGVPRTDWPRAIADYRQTRVAAALEQLKAPAAQPAKVGPSLPLARYAGDYVDPWYGSISIRLERGRLMLDFKQTPGMVGELEHWQYETFRTRWRDRGTEPAYLTFALTAEGTIEKITMKAVSPFADFSFDYHDLLFTPAAATTKDTP